MSTSGAAVPHVTIVGAGLVGALLACFLGRRGYRIDVYEGRPDPRRAGVAGGRSINLAISARGLDALRRVDLADAVLADAVPMPGRMMHAPDGTLTFQAYSKNRRDAINSVPRGKLNLTLLEAADARDNVTVHFGQRCRDVDLDRPAATFEDEAGVTTTAECDLIIGTDGAFSAVRARLQRTDRFSYEQSYLEHGYKELTIPPTADGGFAMDPNALHIWPRGGYMMIALPNPDGSFTCTCFWPFAGPHSFDRLDDDAKVRAYFEQHFGDAVPLMPTLCADYRRNPVSSLVTIRCDPWHHGATVALAGDAAHAIVPFYGQGANAGFEDCVAFDACLDEHGPEWARVLPEYTRRRKRHGDAIADLAIKNFVEMRDSVGSPAFLLGKKLEKLLHRWFPRSFTPLYNMISFTTVPYADARRRAVRQWHMLAAVGIALGVALAVLAAFVVARLI